MTAQGAPKRTGAEVTFVSRSLVPKEQGPCVTSGCDSKETGSQGAYKTFSNNNPAAKAAELQGEAAKSFSQISKSNTRKTHILFWPNRGRGELFWAVSLRSSDSPADAGKDSSRKKGGRLKSIELEMKKEK